MTARIWVVVFILVLTGCSVQSQRPSLNAPGSVEQEILKAENRLAEALNALDDTALDALWADRLVFVGTNGHSSTKAQRLKGVRDARGSAGNRMTSTNDDVRIQVLGSAAAVAYVISSWHGVALPSLQQYRATHVWIREDGAWKLVSAHVSKVAPPN